jgi:nitroimidazol reductase NimA-like FMN-containing flavoprotein (pyridoxamine 5'-phosphate oxidase superfamily)
MLAGESNIVDLSEDDIMALLNRNCVGRIAFAHKGQVDIEPLHYGFDGTDMYVRTAPGTKLTMLGHNPYVAFEVDEVRGKFDWESVVCHGTVYRVEPLGSEVEQTTYTAALAALRRIVPETLTDGDPVPFRRVILRIHIHSKRGVAARPVR